MTDARDISEDMQALLDAAVDAVILILADANARLGVDVGRYSFILADSHRLLLAGLPAHN